MNVCYHETKLWNNFLCEPQYNEDDHNAYDDDNHHQHNDDNVDNNVDDDDKSGQWGR